LKSSINNLFLFIHLRNNQTDSDLTSIDTNFDNQTIKTDINQNQQKPSHHSSISNIDVTIPSNEEIQSEIINSSSNHLLKTSEFEQGDSLSLNDQTINVENLIKK